MVRSIILIGISWGFAGGGYYILIPLLGNNIYQMEGLGIGILYAIDGLGVLTGAFLVKKFIHTQYRRGVIWYGISYLIQAVFFALLAHTNTLLTGMFMLYLMRVCSGIIIPLDTYLLQINTKETIRGRVFSLHMATYGGVMQLSYVVAGWAYGTIRYSDRWVDYRIYFLFLRHLLAHPLSAR